MFVYSAFFCCLFTHTAWRQSSGVRSSRETGRRWSESTCLFCTTRSSATPSPDKMACKGVSVQHAGICRHLSSSLIYMSKMKKHFFIGVSALRIQPLPLQLFNLCCGQLVPRPPWKIKCKNIFVKQWESRPGSYPEIAHKQIGETQHTSCPRTIPHANVTVAEAILNQAV